MNGKWKKHFAASLTYLYYAGDLLCAICAENTHSFKLCVIAILIIILYVG